jgi:hypothetical protein
MIDGLIRFSIQNRLLILLTAGPFVCGGSLTMRPVSSHIRGFSRLKLLVVSAITAIAVAILSKVPKVFAE